MSIAAPDGYLRYQEMMNWLDRAERNGGEWIDLRTIGRTPDDRDIPLVVLGNHAQGHPDDRPAVWVDANLHASELTGSAAALMIIADAVGALAAGDEATSDLFERTTLYVAPRVNPDGAEWCMETGRFVRSVRRPFPHRHPDKPDPPGFEPKDLDGDGEVLQMRVPNPNGAWKVSEHDERLMVPREPWDRPPTHDGPFFDLYPEGVFEDEAWLSANKPTQLDRFGLDFNRNFPYHWLPPDKQKGSGEFPTSEPEVRAIAEFFAERPNICAALSLHTFSGVLLRPFSDRPDSEMPRFDRGVYEVFGRRSEELTGYPGRGSYHYFREGEHDTTHGAFDDWAYAHRGAFSFTMELWSPWRRAGLDFEDEYTRFFGGRDPKEDARLLEWNDEALDGEGFVDWRTIDHPQFDHAEIGGWRLLYAWRNPPESMLEDECEGLPEFIFDLAGALPDPALRVSVETVAGESRLKKVTATLENHGYLPTDITAHARERGLVEDSHLKISCDDGVEIIDGALHRRIEPLDGWANVTQPEDSAFTWRGEPRRERTEVVWLVRGEGKLEVSWWGDRIGQRQSSVRLP